MSSYLKNLLNEQEKQRILNLHETRKVAVFKGLLKEEDGKTFFDNQKARVGNFPDGKVIKLASGEEVYQVPATGAVKYYLRQDGTAFGADQKTISTNSWKKSTAIEGGLPKKEAGQLGTQPGEGEIITQSGGEEPTMMSGKELGQAQRQGERELRQNQREINRLERQSARQKRRDDKAAVQECNTNFSNFVKYEGQIMANAKQKELYTNFLNTCCDILKDNPQLKGKPFCVSTEPEPIKNETAPGSPVYYPWLDNGVPSLEKLANSRKSDPNLQGWLGELKKLNIEQLNKVNDDWKNVLQSLASQDKEGKYDQDRLIAMQTIQDAKSMAEKNAATAAKVGNVMSNLGR